MSLGSVFKGIFVAIWHVFKPIEQDAIRKFEEKITPEVMDAVKQGIVYAASLALSDIAAREAAIEKAKADLVEAGHDIGAIAKYEWNAILEIGYVALHGSNSIPAPAPPATDEPAS